MTAGLFPPIELVQQPRVQDITAGRPYRFAGIPVSNDPPLNAVSYWLEVTADDKYGSTVVFALGPTGLPVFELTAQQTAQLGTLLASTGANGFDNTGGTTAVGWFRIYGQGTNVTTTETETQLAGHGPVLVRLTSQLRRKDKILLGSGTCGCAGGPVCGCGNGGGCATCDHPLPPTDGDGCNELTQRARVKGRWRGPYSEFPDSLGPYVRFDVVSQDGKNYVYIGPADGVTACQPPGA